MVDLGAPLIDQFFSISWNHFEKKCKTMGSWPLEESRLWTVDIGDQILEYTLKVSRRVK